MRRRFTFIDLRPEFDTEDFRSFLEEHEVEPDVIETVVVRMLKLNDEIRAEKTNLGPGFEIGHSFFWPQGTEEELGMDWYRSIIRVEIAPLCTKHPRFSETTPKTDAEIAGIVNAQRSVDL